MGKKIFAIFGITFLVYMMTITHAHPVSLGFYNLEDPDEVVRAYFRCLKEGDLDNIAHLIGGKLLREKKRLLQNKNNNYAAFLKNHYADTELASISFDRITASQMLCKLRLIQGNDVIQFKLNLTRFNGSWQITDDLSR